MTGTTCQQAQHQRHPFPGAVEGHFAFLHAQCNGRGVARCSDFPGNREHADDRIHHNLAHGGLLVEFALKGATDALHTALERRCRLLGATLDHAPDQFAHFQGSEFCLGAYGGVSRLACFSEASKSASLHWLLKSALTLGALTS